MSDVVERETELHRPVSDFLVARGYTVRSEVHGCDITATKGDELIVVELKRHFSVDLLVQAIERRRLTDSVYVAVPRPDKGHGRWRGIRKLLRRLELGLIFVSSSRGRARVEVVLHPGPYQPRKAPRARRAVIDEIGRRSKDYNEGGSTRRKLLTAYREEAIHIACLLDAHGPSRPKALRALGTSPRTLSILSRNVYGWFERVSHGVYGITEEGRNGLAVYEDVARGYKPVDETSAAG